MTLKFKLIKLITMFLIVAILSPFVLLSVPKQAGAGAAVVTDPIHTKFTVLNKILLGLGLSQETITAVVKTKEWAWQLLEELAKAVAMRALQEITKSTINWVNSGFHGSPLFLENPESFFKDIAKYEVRSLVDMYGYDQLKYPFGRDFALNTISAYKSQLEQNTQYSLSNYISDPVLLKSYQTDFSVGGWSGFMINNMYPQNNYIGFQLEANEELARRVSGTFENNAEKVQKTLDQGMGFLSPQTCTTNSSYNNMSNQFNAPSFNQAKWEKDWLQYNPRPVSDPKYGSVTTEDVNAWTLKYKATLNEAQTNWKSKSNPSYCPPREDGAPGLVNTTPGSVIANQIMGSVETPSELKKLAVNSGTQILSAIFDQLLNQLVGKGLNALSSNTNRSSQQAGDDWSYNGLTLGGPATVDGYGTAPSGNTSGGTTPSWDSGPDIEIALPEFKQTINKAVSDSQTEIQLITDTLAELNLIWPEARKLDLCVPGPDIYWDQRLDEEKNANFTKFQGDNLSSSQINDATKELEDAVSFLKDWIDNKMMTELPNSTSYLDSVDQVKNLSQQAKELTDKRRTRTQSLTQLQNIKTSLDSMSSQPEAGSTQEQQLVSLRKQYSAMQLSLTNSYTLDDARNELAVARGKKDGLKRMTLECESAREAKGWGTPGGRTSSYSGPINSPVATVDDMEANTEQALFCNLPINGGYTHKMFVGPDFVRPQLPIVNALGVLPNISVAISCTTIYEANILDYKGDLSGITDVTEGP